MGVCIAHIDLPVYNAPESNAARKSDIDDIGQDALPQYIVGCVHKSSRKNSLIVETCEINKEQVDSTKRIKRNA